MLLRAQSQFMLHCVQCKRWTFQFQTIRRIGSRGPQREVISRSLINAPSSTAALPNAAGCPPRSPSPAGSALPARVPSRAAAERLPRMRAQGGLSRAPRLLTSRPSSQGRRAAGVFQNGRLQAPPRPRKVSGRPFGGSAVVAGNGGLEIRA